MEITIQRLYHNAATCGLLLINGIFKCFTIELPWRDNINSASCIPEGRYELAKRSSEKFGKHLILLNVPKRELILIHAANDAVKELRGCIAPVSALTAPGTGTSSKVQVDAIVQLAYKAIDEGKKVFITIKR